MKTVNIMIVGVGGQGTLLTSRILGGIAVEQGYDVKISEVHGMAQRGGSVVTYVRYGEYVAEPIVEEGHADVLIAFERLEALRYAHFLKKDGIIICNDQKIEPMTVSTGKADYPEHILETLKENHRVVAVNAMEEAKKLGFDECILPQVSLDSMKDSGSVPKGIRLTGVRSVKDAMDAILK